MYRIHFSWYNKWHLYDNSLIFYTELLHLTPEMELNEYLSTRSSLAYYLIDRDLTLANSWVSIGHLRCQCIVSTPVTRMWHWHGMQATQLQSLVRPELWTPSASSRWAHGFVRGLCDAVYTWRGQSVDDSALSCDWLRNVLQKQWLWWT